MDLRETPLRSFQRHPWETARLRFFRDLLVHHGLTRDNQRILDVGAGDAWFSRQLLKVLPEGATITCWDIGYAADVPQSEPRLAFCRETPEGLFRLALMLDVLEHVPDDAAFLNSVLERLHPGSTLLISVPAWSRLIGSHDEALAHYRRYDPASARQLLARAGLEIHQCGGLFHGLLLPRAVAVALERLRFSGRTSTTTLEWRWGAVTGRVLDRALAWDNAVSRLAARRGLELPGLSWWALCRKP